MNDINNIKEKKLNKLLEIIVILMIILLVFFEGGIFLLYGPWTYIKDTIVTSAMTTYSHQWIAKAFYSDKTIEEVMKRNTVIESDEDTNTDNISIDVGHVTKYSSYSEQQVLKRDVDNDLYKVVPISGAKYKGYMVVIYDPSRIKLTHSAYLGNKGQNITDLAKENGATIAINASGFDDPGMMGNGGYPHGIVIEDGKILWNTPLGIGQGGIIGFNQDNILVLAKTTANKAIEMGIRDAVSFSPFLIVNGKPSFIRGNGGWGIAPRTAIGQRKDGIVLFLVIDGRQATSIGADMVDLTEILVKYGAYNAANLDGGSSTGLVIDNKIINHPVASTKTGERRIPDAWIVK